ncbi:hypothetical protein [Reyranella massiliensis]|uniref:hypothetical protein n=1 Tax=Reyranella massiliensis TaxID=445220 RepID=UPI00031861E9|nr:hypothetical protein [Reyranella massiliensis]
MNVVSEDGLSILLARIEHLAGELTRLKGVDRARSEAERDLARAARERNEAQNKVDEWAIYAGQLRELINPAALKRKKIVLPEMPKPLETEIPF